MNNPNSNFENLKSKALKKEILYPEESYKIQGAIFEVYKEMGSGFLEAVYQECLNREFRAQNIPFKSQPELDLYYKEELLDKKYKPDFICYDNIIVELKAIKKLENDNQAQVINYLNATNLELGLLVNFGAYPKVEIKRLINLR